MAIRTDFTAGEVLAAADLNDTFAAKLNLAGGKVLQVVHASYSTTTTNNTLSYADTGLTATITPSNATSKVLVIVTQAGVERTSGNNDSHLLLRLLRGATTLTTFETLVGYTATSLSINLGTQGITWLDSPATTSATTYKTQFASSIAGITQRVNAENATSSIVLMEVSA